MLSYGSGLPAPWLQKKIDRAIKTIQDWLEKCDRAVYVSCSGGKDSNVAADLITRVHPDCPLVWVNQGPLAEWPDCVELLELWKQQGRNVVELCPVRSLWKLYQDYGIPLEGTMNTKIDKLINQRLMYDPLNDYQELHGIKGYAWGLRQESKSRKKLLRSRGELYQKSNGLWVCSPVGFWSTEEVWWYIDSQQIPYPAMYDQDRMTIRNGPPIGTTGVNWGRLAELRAFHPEYYSQFVSAYPEISKFT